MTLTEAIESRIKVSDGNHAILLNAQALEALAHAVGREIEINVDENNHAKVKVERRSIGM